MGSFAKSGVVTDSTIPARVGALESGKANTSAVPQPAASAPPAVADSSAPGTTPLQYAMADHTHASKARKARLQCAANGTLTWTYSTPFASGVVPRIVAIAETAGGTDVINVQLTATPTNTSASLIVNRVQQSVVALIGLTILSVPTQPGVQWVHLLALEP